MANAKTKSKSIEMNVLGVVDENEATSAMVNRLEAEADAEIAGRTVTLRWGKRQIDVVKRAATLMGLPYQTYLKQVVYRQAVADILESEALDNPKSAPAARKPRRVS